MGKNSEELIIQRFNEKHYSHFYPLFLLFFSLIFFFSCEKRENGNRGNKDGNFIIDRTGKLKSSSLRIVDFYPPDKSTVIFARPQIYVRFNLPVTDFSIFLTPEVKGSTYYIPDKFSLIFLPEEDLLLNYEYKIYVSAKNIFSGEVTYFSWSFFTPRAFPSKAQQDEVRVTSCFKNKFRIKLEFSQPVTFQVYVNSYKLSEGAYTGFPVEIESDRFVREGENTVEVIAISTTLEGEYVKERFSFTITKDNIPPSIPSVLSLSRTKFRVSSRDNCTPDEDIRYFLFWSEDENSDKMELIGEVGVFFDTRHIAFDGGFICVKALDSAGNMSDCSQRKRQGFSSREFYLTFPCDTPFLFSRFIACNLKDQNGEKFIGIYNSPISLLAKNDLYHYSFSDTIVLRLKGKIIDICDDQLVALTDDGLIFIEEKEGENKLSVKNLSVKGSVVSCSPTRTFVSDGESLFIIENGDVKSTFSKRSIRFNGIPFVNDEAKIKDIFATPVSVFVVLSNWTPAYFISQVTGEDYDRLKEQYPTTYAVLLTLRAGALPNILFAKEYFDNIRKLSVFLDIPVYLVGKDAFADFSFPKGVGGSTQVSSGVKDIYVIDYDGDITKELIFLIEKKENNSEGTSTFLIKIIDGEE